MKAWALLLAALTIFLVVCTAFAGRGEGFDFAPVLAAGQLAGTPDASSMYAHDTEYYNRVFDPVFLRASRNTGFAFEPTPFVYPPLVATIAGLAPAGRFTTVSRLWAWLSSLALVAGLALALASYLPRAATVAGVAWTLIAVCVFEPVLYGFWLGQTTAVVFFLIMAAVALQRRGHPMSAGVLLAIAAYVKITPVLLAAVWLWRGQRRAALWSIAALAGLWVISICVNGVALNVAYLERVLQIGQTSVLALNNHSLPAFLGRFVQPPAGEWQVQAMPLSVQLVTLAGALTLLIAAMVVAPKRNGAPDLWLPGAESLAFVAILLIPNVAWTHYFVLLLPGIGVLLATPSPAAGPWRALGALSFLLCCRFVVPPQELLPAVEPHRLATAPTVAALLVCVAILVRARVARSTSQTW